MTKLRAHVVVVVMLSGCVDGPALMQSAVSPPTGETAVLGWAAFRCAVYANLSGKPVEERERLFNLGYDNAKRFLEALRRDAISKEDLQQKVPIGFSMSASGPTTEFALGRVYELINHETYERITKNDSSGMPLPLGKWITDDELIKLKADTGYQAGNCALIK